MYSVSKEYINQCVEKFSSWRTNLLLRRLLENLTGPQLVQKFPPCLWNSKVHCLSHKSPLPVPFPINPVHISIPLLDHIFEFYHPTHAEVFHLAASGLPTKVLYASVLSPTPATSHSSWFDHPNNIWWKVQIMKPNVCFWEAKRPQALLRSTQTGFQVYSPSNEMGTGESVLWNKAAKARSWPLTSI